jgi:Uma2 family endonuclease
MTAPMPHLWTGDEYDRLPADDGVRRELVDGVLHVSPSPAQNHQSLAAELCVMLRRSAPRDLYRVTQGVEVKLGDRLRFIPDVLAVNAGVRKDASQFLAHEVILAVEIESPSSVSMDRLLKPAHYAAAGIPFYWRIQLEPEPTLIAHEAAGDTYRVTGEYTGVVALEAPWPVGFDLRELAY